MQRICLLILIASSVSCSLVKDSGNGGDRSRTHVEIIIGQWDSVSGSFPVAIQFKIPTPWKMFWMNTGAFDVKPYEIAWQLPEDWRADKLLFPVPTKLVDKNRLEYIYRDSLTLSTRIYTSKSPGQGPVQLKLRWLECTPAICMWRDSSIEFTYKPVQPGGFPRIDTLPILANLGVSTGAFSDSTTDRRGSYISWYVKVMDSDLLKVTDYYPSYSENARVQLEMIGDRAYIDVDLVDPKLEYYGIVGGIIFINHQPYWESIPMLWPPDSA